MGLFGGGKKKTEEKLQSCEKTLALQKELQEAVNRKLAETRFHIDRQINCLDRILEEPVRGDKVTFKQMAYPSRLFLVDNRNRRVLYAKLGDSLNLSASSTETVIWNYDELRGCEMIFNGTRSTSSTYIGNSATVGNVRVHSGDVHSTSTDYVTQLGLKFILSDPVNPTYTVNLLSGIFSLNGKILMNDIRVRAAHKFATEVRDTVNAIVRG